MSMRSVRRGSGAAIAAALIATACGGAEATTTASPDAPTIVATTSIWADVVRNVVCDADLNVVTMIPTGANPHTFEPSLADRGVLDDASLIVSNGLALEESLVDVLDTVEDEGIPVFAFADHMTTIEFSAGDDEHGDDEHGDEDHDDEHGDEDHDDEHGDDEHGDEEHDDEHGDEHGDEDHDDEDHDDEHGDEDHDEHGDEDHDEDHDEHGDEDEHGHDAHAHDGGDPHIWFDPSRVAGVIPELAEEVSLATGVDMAEIEECAADYAAELVAVDAEISEMMAEIPADDRILVTNHESLGYFADRYDFDVLGTIIPEPNGLAEANPAQLAELAEEIEEAGVSAVFAETQQSSDDAEALADSMSGVEVITLLAGTLGDEGSGADTYLTFLTTNAENIASGLS